MKKNVTVEAIIGFCCFVALMCGGFYWLISIILNAVGQNAGGFSWLRTIQNVCSIVLTVAGVILGWMWISGTNMNKTLKIVLEVFFVIFAVLAIMGYIGIGF